MDICIVVEPNDCFIYQDFIQINLPKFKILASYAKLLQFEKKIIFTFPTIHINSRQSLITQTLSYSVTFFRIILN